MVESNSAPRFAQSDYLRPYSILTTSLSGGWGRPIIIAFMQVRKPKLSVAKSRPKDKDTCVAELDLQCRQLTGASLLASVFFLDCRKSPKPEDSTQPQSLPEDR